MKLSFARKVQFGAALGLLSDAEKAPFVALNSIRNGLAHQYHYVVTDNDAQNLVNSLPRHWQEAEPVAEYLEKKSLSHTLTIGILVVYTIAQNAVERVLDEHAARKRLREALDRSYAREAREKADRSNSP